MIAAVVLLAGLLGSASVARSAPAPNIDMADLFLVEQDGSWFCDDTSNVSCPADHGSRGAARDLLNSLQGSRHPDLYLRVAKARNNCVAEQNPPACRTGVPDPNAAGLIDTLRQLRRLDVKLGVVVGAEEDGPQQVAREVENLAWQACQISHADTEHLYAFVFLDLTRSLDRKSLKAAVHLIRTGRKINGERCGPGWPKVIVNDNHTKTLHTEAWAHAKRFGLLDAKVPDKRIRRAAEGRGVFLTRKDRAFVRKVKQLDDGSFAILRYEVSSQTDRMARMPRKQQCSLLTQSARLQQQQGYRVILPVFVHGIPGQTRFYDSFKQGTFALQMALMKRYPGPSPAGRGTGCGANAGAQRSKAQRSNAPRSKAQRSKAQRSKAPRSKAQRSKAPRSKAQRSKTPRSKAQRSKAQRSKAQRSKAPRSKAPRSKAPRSKAQRSKAQGSKAPRPEPEAAPPGALPAGPAPAPAFSPPAPVRRADAQAQEPTALTCDSARLHGWVNPHGSATTFHFEYWKRDENVHGSTGGGDAGAGRDRTDVSRVASALQADTSYSAVLIADNAGGRSASSIVSFKTRARCG